MTSSISFLPESVDLICYAGDGASLKLNVKDDAGNIVPLEGEILAQVRHDRAADEALVTFKVDLTEGENGVLIIWLSGEDTASLIPGNPASNKPFKGVWDVQWTAVDDEPKTLVQGNLTCNADVSH